MSKWWIITLSWSFTTIVRIPCNKDVSNENNFSENLMENTVAGGIFGYRFRAREKARRHQLSWRTEIVSVRWLGRRALICSNQAHNTRHLVTDYLRANSLGTDVLHADIAWSCTMLSTTRFCVFYDADSAGLERLSRPRLTSLFGSDYLATHNIWMLSLSLFARNFQITHERTKL